MKAIKRLTVIDFFCGAGGFSDIFIAYALNLPCVKIN